MRKAIKIDNQVIIGVPYQWKRKDTPNDTTYGYNTASFTDEDHLHDGWDKIEEPVYDSETHYLGEFKHYPKEKVWRYDIVSYTPEEISERVQAEQRSNSELNREQKIKEASDAMVVAELMNETDIETVLGNMDIYPEWKEGLTVKNKADSPNGIPDRLKAFNKENELTLYEVVLSHTTQSDWQPKDTPNLFKVVAPDGVIPVWVKPEGAHDAYNIDDKVHFPTASDPIYESKINGNTYSPTEYPAGWKLIP